MIDIEDVKTYAFLGQPIPLNDICKIYTPLISDLFSTIGKDKYYYYVNLLTMDIADVREILEKRGASIPDTMEIFPYLMSCADNDEQFFLDFKTALSTFIKEDVKIAPKGQKIIIGNIISQRIIDKDSFFDLQQIISAINKLPVKTRPPADETPMQKKFRIKREERERVKAKKHKEGQAIAFDSLLSAFCVYFSGGINPLNIGSLNIYQFKDMLEKAQARDKYQTEIDMLLAGADSKKIKPEFWY